MNFSEDRYGFTWGAVKIERHCSDDKRGWVQLGIMTPKGRAAVYVTKTGKMRIIGVGQHVSYLQTGTEAK